MSDEGHFYCEGSQGFELEYCFIEQESRGEERYDLRDLPLLAERQRLCDCAVCRCVRAGMLKAWRDGD